MHNSPPNLDQELQSLEPIAAQAASIRDIIGQQAAERSHADVCLRQKIESQKHELRSFVVKQSVFRMHGLVAAPLALIAVILWAPLRIHADRGLVLSLIAIVICGVSASMRNIQTAVQDRAD